MMDIISPETKRLVLRQWTKADWPAFAAINVDPVVMKYYPSVLSIVESNAMAQKLETLLADRGWGFWAVEKREDKKFIGFVGLHVPDYELPVSPCVEIGWRLAKQHWGYGYATEAAKASLVVAFEKLDLATVYSFTSVTNQKSRAVMERLNMINTGRNFQHPMIPKNHPLREHVLYQIDKQHWAKTKT